MKVDYKKDLNPEQHRVVTQADGPCLVLAGPGSGKTRTLTYRVAYLLENDIPAPNILLMTFTNKAANHMQHRLEVLLKTRPAGLWCGTFHHIGNRSIRPYIKHLGYREDYGILDEEDQRSLVKFCIKALKLNKGPAKLFPSASVLVSIISYSKNAAQSLEKTVLDKHPHLANFIEDIKKIARIYERRKKESNNLDYDDLLICWIKILKSVPAAKERFTRQFKYILVDEYQDTNRLQFDIVRLLSAHHKNILVVGDDAQSIYSFRAADINNILDFPARFKGTKIFKLETNYRSLGPVLNIANNIILKNERQFKKTLTGIRNDINAKPPFLTALNDIYAQALFVTQKVSELNRGGIPLHEIAVLYRAHYQSAELELQLIKQGVPYVIRGGVRFFEQAHVKDILSYLKIVQNPRDELSWIRALSLHPGIGYGYSQKVFKKTATSRLKMAESFYKEAAASVPKNAREGLGGFSNVLKKLTEPAVLERPDTMIREVLSNWYEEYMFATFEDADNRLEDIRELMNFAHSYKDLKEFLSDATLREDSRGEKSLGPSESEGGHLVLSTIHKAKGLEWKAVFIIGLCDGQFPHPKSLEEPLQLEEERRLFYVAVTRAKDRVYLTYPVSRFDYTYGIVASGPSLFLQELDGRCYEKEDIEQQPVYYNDF
ncbi:MAG: ATP-dependent helicase [Candidatus Omnitrophica bacterium]|nr:ATP-dependent helicase [Candidatus Omnitrophota bacterium]